MKIGLFVLLLLLPSLLQARGDDSSRVIVKIRCGHRVFEANSTSLQQTIELTQGKFMLLTYPQAEIVNMVKVLGADGNVLLLTKSLDKTIILKTESLGKGAYQMEIGSGAQKMNRTLVVL